MRYVGHPPLDPSSGLRVSGPTPGVGEYGEGRGGVGDGRAVTKVQGPGGQAAPDTQVGRARGSIPLRPVRMREALYHSEGWERELSAVSRGTGVSER